MKTVAVLVGSLRQGSLNRRLANALAKLAAGRLAFAYLDAGALPMYNDDLWADPPASVLRLKQQVADADAGLVATPEYNRAMPALVKNAIDWGSRPKGQSCWSGKPTAIVGTSPGAIGTAAAQGGLRDLLLVVDAVVMGQPEVYLAWKPEHFDEHDSVVEASTRKFLEAWVERFDAWIERVGPRG